MKQCKWVGTGCLAVALSIAGSVAWSQANPGYTVAEYNAYIAAASAKNPADKITLLDAFVAMFPTSSLLPLAYRNYHDAYFRQKNYPKAIEYVDKLLSMGPRRLQEAFHDRPDPNAPLLVWLFDRAQAFLMGCDQPELRTPEAYAVARDAAVQGQQELSRLQKPSPMMADAQATMKKNMGLAFDSVTQIAESGLQGKEVACKPPAVTGPSDEDLQKAQKEGSERYDSIIERLKREAPPVQYAPNS
jgi:tetratricopeptide (TPR) repeat protein